MGMSAPQQTRHGGVPGEGTAVPVSFEAIFRAYARVVGRWAERLGGPGVEADETVQEVFVTVNRRLPEFQGEEKLASWLFQITTRVVANQRRAVRRRRFRWVTLSRDIADWAVSTAPGPGEVLEAHEASQRFYRALDELREHHRNVLVLFELEQLSTEEIAVLVDRPPATVRVWLHRARAAFTKGWRREADLDGDRASREERR